jgi:hypothetical protein
LQKASFCKIKILQNALSAKHQSEFCNPAKGNGDSRRIFEKMHRQLKTNKLTITLKCKIISSA